MKKNSVFALLLTVVLVGCGAGLEEVRDYARESAKLSAYTELTNRFRDTYQREEPYLSGQAKQLAIENNERRKKAYQDLMKIHRCVSLYMQTLAILAGEDAFDVSKEIDTLAGGIKAYPDIGIEDEHVDAISTISKIITNWVTSSYQKRAVRDLVKEGDAHLQTMLEGMKVLVGYYRKTAENEKKSVLGFFEVEIPFADTPQDRLLVTLARAHVQSKLSEYENAGLKYDQAERGIKSVAEGHKKILENIDKLSDRDAMAIISKLAKEIKTIRENLQVVHD